MTRRILDWSPAALLACGAALIAVLALIDWQVEINATLGFLYIFPMVLLGTVLGWALVWILVGFAILGLTWLWCLYRVLRGFLAFNDGKAMPI